MTSDYNNQHLVSMKQVIPPQDEARNDLNILTELSEHWERGGYERLIEGKSELAWLETFYNIVGQRGASQQVTLPSLVRFWQYNALTEMPGNAASAQFTRFTDSYCDPRTHPLRVGSGKTEIYPVKIAGCGYAGRGGHLMWLEPDEWFGNAEPDQLQLLSAYPAHRLHNQLNYNTLCEQYAVAGREPMAIYPQDAHARDIMGGDTVRMWNQCRRVSMGMVVTAGIRSGVICIHESVWPDLDLAANGICKNGAINVLTKDLLSSRLGDGYVGNTALAQLEKYSGLTLAFMASGPPVSP